MGMIIMFIVAYIAVLFMSVICIVVALMLNKSTELNREETSSITCDEIKAIEMISKDLDTDNERRSDCLPNDMQSEKHYGYKESHRIRINSKTEYKPQIIPKSFDFPGKTPNPQHDERYYLIFTKVGICKLKDAIDWGKESDKNHIEQGGVLLGRVCQFEKEIYNIVEDIILADTKGDPTFVEFTPNMWADMQNELVVRNKKRDSDQQMVITGWFHTHPNSLPVFMSNTDMNTQRLNFREDWQASIVLNPHRKEYKGFFGENAKERKVITVDNITRI